MTEGDPGFAAEVCPAALRVALAAGGRGGPCTACRDVGAVGRGCWGAGERSEGLAPASAWPAGGRASPGHLTFRVLSLARLAGPPRPSASRAWKAAGEPGAHPGGSGRRGRRQRGRRGSGRCRSKRPPPYPFPFGARSGEAETLQLQGEGGRRGGAVPERLRRQGGAWPPEKTGRSPPPATEGCLCLVSRTRGTIRATFGAAPSSGGAGPTWPKTSQPPPSGNGRDAAASPFARSIPAVLKGAKGGVNHSAHPPPPGIPPTGVAPG